MRELRGVAVGAGNFGRCHFDAWSRIEGVVLTSVCEIDAEAAERMINPGIAGEDRAFAGDGVFATQPPFADRLCDGGPFETSGAMYRSSETRPRLRGLAGDS